jgi:hypothetical protein
MARRDSRAIALRYCFSETRLDLMAALFAERIYCVWVKDEIHYSHDLHRPLVLVSI